MSDNIDWEKFNADAIDELQNKSMFDDEQPVDVKTTDNGMIKVSFDDECGWSDQHYPSSVSITKEQAKKLVAQLIKLTEK